MIVSWGMVRQKCCGVDRNASRLGLQGVVMADDFRMQCEGKHPSTEQLLVLRESGPIRKDDQDRVTGNMATGNS